MPGRWPKGFADLQPRHLHRADGSVGGHDHCQMHVVRGVAQLGAETNDPRYLEWAKGGLRALPKLRLRHRLGARSPATGTITKNHDNHTEMCLVADMLETEVLSWPARGRPSYWDSSIGRSATSSYPAQFVLNTKIGGHVAGESTRIGRRPKPRSVACRLLKDMDGGFLSDPDTQRQRSSRSTPRATTTARVVLSRTTGSSAT